MHGALLCLDLRKQAVKGGDKAECAVAPPFSLRNARFVWILACHNGKLSAHNCVERLSTP
jgi:hypothetical protein